MDDLHHHYRRLLLLTALLLVGTLRGADTVGDPDLDFIQIPDALLSEIGLLREDTIKRLELDVHENGKPYVFLTFDGSGSKAGPVWICYEPLEGGNYRRIDTFDDGQTFQFRTDLLFAGKYPGVLDQGGLLVVYPDKGGGPLVRYQFGNGTAHLDEIRDLDYSRPEDKKLFKAIFKRDVDKPLPAEYFAAPSYRVLSAKEVRARGSKRLTKPASDAPPSTVPSNRTETPASAKPISAKAPVPSLPTQPVAESSAAVIERKAPVWPWVVGILALLAIVAFALKQRA